ERHGIVVADRGFQEAFGVVGGRRVNDFQAGRVHEIHFRIRGMKRAAMNAASRWPPQHHWHGRAPAIVGFGDEVRHLIEAAGDEIDELHLDDGPKAEIAHAAGRANDTGLADGRVDHAFGTEPREQSFGHLKRTAVNADIFAERDDGGIAVHLLEYGLADSFEHGDRGHQCRPRLPRRCFSFSARSSRKARSLGPRPKGTRNAAAASTEIFSSAGVFAAGLANAFWGALGARFAGAGGVPLPRPGCDCFTSAAAFISAAASGSSEPKDFTSQTASTLQFGGVNSFFERCQSASIAWQPSQ